MATSPAPILFFPACVVAGHTALAERLARLRAATRSRPSHFAGLERYTIDRLVGSPLHRAVTMYEVSGAVQRGRNRRFTFDCCWPCYFSISAPKHCFFAGIGRNKSRFSPILDFTQCFTRPNLKPFMFICCSISSTGFCSDHCFFALPISPWTGSGLVRRPSLWAAPWHCSSSACIFGGVHNSFYFAGPLMWICPPCASPSVLELRLDSGGFFCPRRFLADRHFADVVLSRRRREA